MRVNIIELQELLKSEFAGNQNAFSIALGVNRTHFNKILKNNGSGAGGKFCIAILKYCNDNNMDYRRFIFLDNNVNKKHRQGGNKNVNKL